MGKKRASRFNGRRCAYCGIDGVSSTGDHVVAKKFFPLADRGYIPQVPACWPCNNDKSILEGYLTAVLPFGAADNAQEHLLALERRLAENERLRRILARSYRRITDPDTGEPTGEISLDPIRVDALFERIVKGLHAHHLGPLPPAVAFSGVFFTGRGWDIFNPRLFSAEGIDRKDHSFGAGAFTYSYVEIPEVPGFVAWKASLFGLRYRGGEDGEREVARGYFAYIIPHTFDPAALDGALRKYGFLEALPAQ